MSIILPKFPSKAEIGVAGDHILGEGEKVVLKGEAVKLSNGTAVSYEMPAPKPNIPDWSEIKSIKHYFNRRGFAPYPAWLFHPSEPDRLVLNAEEAWELGVVFRETTESERAKYGRLDMWDWNDGENDKLWRPTPYKKSGVDPVHLSHGKNLVIGEPNAAHAQRTLLAELIPAVAAAVAKSMQSTGASAPAHIDPAQWDQFIKFQAWQKSQEAVSALAVERGGQDAIEEEAAEIESQDLGLSPEQLRAELTKIAVEKGIKVKKSWDIDDIKAALDEAA